MKLQQKSLIRAAKLQSAIDDDKLPLYHGRAVGTQSLLARIADVPNTTIRYAFVACDVRSYVISDAVLLVDAADLAEHFRHVKVGRKSVLKTP